jgi:radical SAM protein with 4Fe4S-binding SPASM domain
MAKSINLENIKSLFFSNKTLKQIIFKNTFWLVVAEFFDRGLGFLVAVLVARNYGPENKTLRRAQQHRKQEEIYYRTDLENCKNCKIRQVCTSGKQRTIARSFYEELNEKHSEYTKTPEFVKGQVLRKVISEGKFGEAKNNYGLRFAKYVGLQMMKLQTFFTACIQNCVRMLKMAMTNAAV